MQTLTSTSTKMSYILKFKHADDWIECVEYQTVCIQLNNSKKKFHQKHQFTIRIQSMALLRTFRELVIKNNPTLLDVASLLCIMQNISF